MKFIVWLVIHLAIFDTDSRIKLKYENEKELVINSRIINLLQGLFVF